MLSTWPWHLLSLQAIWTLSILCNACMFSRRMPLHVLMRRLSGRRTWRSSYIHCLEHCVWGSFRCLFEFNLRFLKLIHRVFSTRFSCYTVTVASIGFDKCRVLDDCSFPFNLNMVFFLQVNPIQRISLLNLIEFKLCSASLMVRVLFFQRIMATSSWLGIPSRLCARSFFGFIHRTIHLLQLRSECLHFLVLIFECFQLSFECRIMMIILNTGATLSSFLWIYLVCKTILILAFTGRMSSHTLLRATYFVFFDSRLVIACCRLC